MSASSIEITPLSPGHQRVEAATSAVSWAAILAGAAVAASVTLIMLTAGSGFGLALVSPWAGSGVSATTFTISAGIWLIVVQWLASGVGGYITGRLRTKWVGTHTHEVFFRDTAHGFIMWSVATVIGAALLATAASSVVGTTVKATAMVGAGATQGATASMATNTSLERSYDIDSLFRAATPDAGAAGRDPNGEAGRILATGLINGDVSPSDRAYLAQLVSARAGISQADAQKRVDDVIAKEKAAEEKAKQVADAARKSAAAFSIFSALSMLIGAFIACAAAAFGGQLRDEHP